MLFLDGHGSHLNLTFLEWCLQHKILVAWYPPHSTHRLQPLDVGCFAPLASYCSQGLDGLIRRSEGHTVVKKRDFFALFWPAFQQAFRKEVITSAWLKAGIWPFDPQAVLMDLPEQHTPPNQSQSKKRHWSSSPPSVFDTPSQAKKIRHSLNQLSTRTSPSTARKLKHLGRAFARQ